MTLEKRTWIILGATSIIAEEFARLVARLGHNLRLVGRDALQLSVIASDLKLRYQVHCDVIVMDFSEPAQHLTEIFKGTDTELDLFIAHSDFTQNAMLNTQTITRLVQVNILASTLCIHNYLKVEQRNHQLIYLSSVAACFGRPKNSLYGASKAAIELFLQGLQSHSTTNTKLIVIRLGFIDTKQTYGLPGIFYAGSPKDTAQACWKALQKNKRFSYYPSFWFLIMNILKIASSFFAQKTIDDKKN